MFLQALFQYNDRRDLWSSNIRFGILSDANTGLFIVYKTSAISMICLAEDSDKLTVSAGVLSRSNTVMYLTFFDRDL
ncbi:MAG: hypothetical protein CM1200mP25_3170 [Acidobacteriota bacterium]|nr:MAG: hypothetical protein CM1200mP25_3170 [Acidobacteriota bacterium]